MNEPIRVLHVVNQMNSGGLENRLMDIYRNINKNLIQFDFLTFSMMSGSFDEEIKQLGGRVFNLKRISIFNFLFISNKVSLFLKTHRYKIVHCHLNQWCGHILKGAIKEGVNVRIAHSRTALNNSTLINMAKNISWGFLEVLKAIL